MLKSYQVQPSLFFKFIEGAGDSFQQTIIAKVVGFAKNDMIHLKHESDDYIIPLNYCKGVELNEDYIFSFGFELIKLAKKNKADYFIYIDNVGYVIKKGETSIHN
ncbi:MAG TPA: hypothetical protein VN922_19400 [Bacteroidia bacterium]|nr:hypothetical protein [Bacteroidia bacterium]